MTSFLVVIFGVAVIVGALAVSRASSSRALELSPLFMFTMSSVVFTNVGFLVYFLAHQDAPWARTGALTVSLGLLCVVVGGVLGTFAFPSSKREASNSFRTEVRTDLPYASAVMVALTLFGIVLLDFFLRGGIPLFEGIRRFAAEGFVPGLLNTPRIQSQSYINPEVQYVPFQGLMDAIRSFGLPVIAVWFADFRRLRVRKKTSTAILVLSGLLIMSTGQRWPLMYMLLTLLIYWALRETDRSSIIRAARVVFVVGLLLGVLLSAFLGRRAIESASLPAQVVAGSRDLAARVFLGNAQVPFFSYEMFANSTTRLGGDSWLQDLRSYLPGVGASFPVTFAQLVTGKAGGFTAPPDFYTEAFINFGVYGVVFMCILWGMFLGAVQQRLVTGKRSMLRLSLASLLLAVLTFSSFTGVAFILGGVLVVGIILALVTCFNLVVNVGRPRSVGPSNPSQPGLVFVTGSKAALPK